jgi:uncharacterized protein (DUF1778 family)
MPAKTSDERRAYDARRRRQERLKLRFTEEEAQSIRDAAAGAGQTVAAFFLACVAGQPRPIVDLSDVAKLSTVVAALLAAPHAVRDLEADLGRLSGRLSHLFTVNYKLALEHRAEIHATLNEVRALRREMRQAVAALQAETIEPRGEVARVLRQVAAALDA